jgi:hypothetical protein
MDDNFGIKKNMIMKQIVINIPESEYRFFMKVIRNFSFVEVDEKKNKLLELEAKLSPANHKIWSSIKEGLKEVELIEQGNMKAKSAKEFLDEL